PPVVHRRAARRRVASCTPDEEPGPVAGDGPGLVTRGVHAGLDGIGWAGSRRRCPWSVIAGLVGLSLLALSIIATSQVPEPLPVTGLTVTYLPGPRLPQSEINAWLHAFPYRDKLGESPPWMLEKLTTYLGQMNAVAEVHRV